MFAVLAEMSRTMNWPAAFALACSAFATAWVCRERVQPPTV